MKKRIIITLLLLLAATTSYISYGQSAGFAAISPDARSFSMGGTGVASSANAFSIFNNSAGSVMSLDKMAIAASYTMWQPDASNNTMISAAGFFKLGAKAALTFGGRSFSYQPMDLTDINGNIDGSFSPAEFSFGIGLAYKILPQLSASANLHYISSDMGGDKPGSAVAADLGFMYNVNKFKIGLTASNIGSKIDYGNGPYSLPANAQLGIGLTTDINDNNKISATVQAGCTFENTSIIAGIGAEYMFKNMVALRVGAHYGDETKGIPPYASAGIGLNIFGITLDCAYLLAGSDSPVRNTLTIGLGYKF